MSTETPRPLGPLVAKLYHGKQKDLAEAIGVSRAAIFHWLHGIMYLSDFSLAIVCGRFGFDFEAEKANQIALKLLRKENAFKQQMEAKKAQRLTHCRECGKDLSTMKKYAAVCGACTGRKYHQKSRHNLAQYRAEQREKRKRHVSKTSNPPSVEGPGDSGGQSGNQNDLSHEGLRKV